MYVVILTYISEIITNVRTNFQETSDNGYLEARSKFLSILMNRAYCWLKRSKFLFSYASEYDTHKKCIEVLKGFSRSMLESRKAARNKCTTSNDDNVLSKTVLDLFLDAGVPDSELRDHIDTFVVAVRICLLRITQRQIVCNCFIFICLIRLLT